MEIKDLEKLKKIADVNDDIEKIKVFQMLREAITAYKTELSIEELSDIKKSMTGEQEND